ncbi:hypothetical protein [Sorangium sp. So ce388]|uniref:hypothetical protein n=1 Tax=Sorangium sp. So ce388 TaxID=3133309 RepID=UPI003F5BB05A
MEEFLNEWDTLADAVEEEIKAGLALMNEVATVRAQLVAPRKFGFTQFTNMLDALEQISRHNTLHHRMMDLSSQLSGRFNAWMRIGERISNLQHSLMMQSTVFLSAVSESNLEHARQFQKRLERLRSLEEQWGTLFR